MEYIIEVLMKFEPSLQLKTRTTPRNQESFASTQAHHLSTHQAIQEYIQSLQALADNDIIEADKLKKTSPKLHYNSDQVPINLPALNWIALRTRPDIAWATSRATSLITHDPDTCFLRVKHICQSLHHTLSYSLRHIPIPPQSRAEAMGTGRCLLCTNRGEESERKCLSIMVSPPVREKVGNLVQWRSSRQDLIAKSTCEAELIASKVKLFNKERTSQL